MDLPYASQDSTDRFRVFEEGDVVGSIGDIFGEEVKYQEAFDDEDKATTRDQNEESIDILL